MALCFGLRGQSVRGHFWTETFPQFEDFQVLLLRPSHCKVSHTDHKSMRKFPIQLFYYCFIELPGSQMAAVCNLSVLVVEALIDL